MVLARASQSVITFADALQVKDLGPGAIAATATGGLNVFGFIIFPMGIAFIVQSFVAQWVGRGDRAATRSYAWYGLAIALVSAVVAGAAIPWVAPILRHTQYSPEVQRSMASYMAIRLLSVGAAVGIEALGNWYGGLGNTRMQMIAGVITMVFAIALNAVLIPGRFGAPALGVDGAAVASVIGTWAGFAFLAVAFWRRWGSNAAGSGPVHFSRREMFRVVRFGLPNGLNWLLEFTAFQAFVNVVVAGLGDTTVAALNVVIAVNSIAFMPAFGLASAGAILAAQSIGKGDRGAVWPQVKLTFACCAAWECAIAAVYLIAPRSVIGLFTPDGGGSELVALGASMLAMSAVWQIFDAAAMTLNETLRAAGDTAWTMAARTVLAWLVFAPGSYAVTKLLHGGAVGAMACLCGYLALLAIALALRFRSGAWKRIELIEPKLV